MSTLRVNTLDGATGGGLINVASGATLYATGCVIQVASSTKTDTFTTTSTSLVDIPGLSVSLIPKAASSKFLILGSVCWGQDTSVPYLAGFVIDRNGTSIGIADAAGNRSRWSFGSQGVFANDNNMYAPINYLDSPATTATLTYKIRCQAETPRTLWINRGGEGDGDSALTGRFTSTITVMEIAG